MLEASRLSRWHDEVIAINDVTVKLNPGITALLGPNGSGKSSLMRLAVGLHRPSAGSIRVLGEDPWDNARLFRRVGYVPEGPAPWPERSGRQCVERAAALSGLADPPSAASRTLDFVGLQEAADRVSGGYSHGMTQRLKLAMACVHEPEFLVLDEPLVGTDPLARRDLLAAMAAMARDGRSLLVATHVLADVDDLGGNIMLLNRGRLVAHGNVAQVRELLDEVPRTVHVGTPNPRSLGAEMWHWDSVLSVEAGPSTVTVRTRSSQVFYAQLQRRGTEGGITSITSPDDSVETVFQHLVG